MSTQPEKTPDVIRIHIDGEFDLPTEDVFPDGIPDPLTIADVIAAVESARSVTRLITEWNLVPSVLVSPWHCCGSTTDEHEPGCDEVAA